METYTLTSIAVLTLYFYSMSFSVDSMILASNLASATCLLGDGLSYLAFVDWAKRKFQYPSLDSERHLG